MKFAIVALLLVAVAGMHSVSGGAAAPTNLSPADAAQIRAILTKALGSKIGNGATKLVSQIANGVLKKIPLKGILHPVVGLVNKLAKNGGAIEKILGGGNAKAAKGPNAKNLTPADQAKLTAILNRTVGPYTSAYTVKLVATLADGLLGKIPLSKILKPVQNLVGKLLAPNALLGKLLGQKGLGKPISKLLGAPGKVLGGLGL